MSIGELSVELHVGVISAAQFYRISITYTLDNIFRFILTCMLLWQYNSLVLCPYSMHLPLGNYQ